MLDWLNCSPKKIAIIGDIILDEYIEGSVSRISPEAPVPIHCSEKIFHRPGGAANTAYNILTLGGTPFLFSVCGQDLSGKELLETLNKKNLNSNFIIQDPERITSKKTRVTSNNQQMIRIDSEKISPITSNQEDQIIENLGKNNFEAIVLSDYGKGVLTLSLLEKIRNFVKKTRIPTLVDPKNSNFNRYNFCDLITPNLKEAREAYFFSNQQNLEDEIELARSLQKSFQLKNILITLGPKGMAYVPKEPSAPVIYKKPDAREVYDVSGAGDTVVSAMAMGIAAKLPLERTIKLANIAAGIVVQKWGTKTATSDEILKVLNKETHPTKSYQDKILNLEKLNAKLKVAKEKNKKIVFTNGCFDLLHAGHLSYLEKAKASGHLLIVGINSDTSIQMIKGPLRPIVSLENRMKLLAGLSCIDYLISFDENTPEKLIEIIKPDVLIKGDDYTIQQIAGHKTVLKSGGDVQTIPLVKGLSSSHIIEKIQQLQNL